MPRILLIAFIATLVLAADRIPAADDAAPSLVGKWILLTATDPDIKGDADNPNIIRLEFDDDTFKVNVTGGAGNRDFEGSYLVDSTQTPSLLDVTLRDGETQQIFAVYRLSGKRLTVRFREDNARPTGVVGTEPDSITLVFRRDDGSR